MGQFPPAVEAVADHKHAGTHKEQGVHEEVPVPPCVAGFLEVAPAEVRLPVRASPRCVLRPFHVQPDLRQEGEDKEGAVSAAYPLPAHSTGQARQGHPRHAPRSASPHDSLVDAADQHNGHLPKIHVVQDQVSVLLYHHRRLHGVVIVVCRRSLAHVCVGGNALTI